MIKLLGDKSMKISTKGRYAITAMMEVALKQNVRPVTLADISEEQGISISYLEQLFARLRKNGLVKGFRGPGGGYHLAKPSQEISVAEIVNAVEDKLRTKKPASESTETHKLITEMWEELSDKLCNYLGEIKLSEFVLSEKAQDFVANNKASGSNFKVVTSEVA